MSRHGSAYTQVAALDQDCNLFVQAAMMESPPSASSPASGAVASVDSIPSSSAQSMSSVMAHVDQSPPPAAAAASAPKHADLVTALQNAQSTIGRKRGQNVKANAMGHKSEDVDAMHRSGQGNALSASEDDELRNSDSSAPASRVSASRSARLAAVAAGAKTPQLPGLSAGQRPSLVNAALSGSGSTRTSSSSVPRAPYAVSGPGDYTVSASSSRSNLNFQSKTSLYRQQANAANSLSHAQSGGSSGDVAATHGHDTSEEGPPGSAGSGANLSRAKSVSSVSSVNSTSSMEAVPFRAAPLGNTRLGFGGYGRGGGGHFRGGTTHRNQAAESSASRANNASQDSSGSQASQAPQEEADATVVPSSSAPNTDQLADLSLADPTIGHSASPSKQRVLPKGPSDDWLYRNAPGMGSSQRQPSRTVTAAGDKARKGLRNVFDIDTPDDDEEGDQSRDGIDGANRSPMTNIRSKLVKRAGKLGLRPLTNVQSSSVLGMRSSPQMQPGLYVQTDNLRVLGQARAQGTSLGGLDGDQSEGMHTRTSSTGQLSAVKASMSLGSSGSSSANLAATFLGRSTSPFDPDGTSRRTSSVTNAPLVVPKNPPGPPGSAPPPSPGLTGMSAYPFSPSLLQGSPHASNSSRVDENVVSLSATASPIARRPGSAFNAGIMTPVGGAGNRSSGSTIGFPQRSETNTPPLTPAQQIQLDVRAGTATLPSEPSGASPGPSHEDADSLIDGKDASKRPASTSMTVPKIVKPAVHRFSGTSSVTRAQGSTIPENASTRRPPFFRALSKESNKSGKSSQDSRHSAQLAVQKDAKILTEKKTSEVVGDDTITPEAQGIAETAGKSTHSANVQPDGTTQDASKIFAANEIADAEPRGPPPSELYSALMGSSQAGADEHADDMRLSELPSLAISATSSTTSLPEQAPAQIPNAAPIAPSIPAVDGKLTSVEQSVTDNVGSAENAPSSQSDQYATSSSGIASAAPTKSDIRASSRTARTAKDFFFGDLLGEGSYSTVIEAWDLVPLREKGLLDEGEERFGGRMNAMAAFAGKTSGRKGKNRPKALESTKPYAVKVLDKMHILKQKKQKYVGTEKEALSIMNRHPGVITLYWTFQDADSLYFVLELAPRGELLTYIKKLGSFNEECARFYAAQLLDTIEALHNAGILHRDIKPENVLLDDRMRIRLADFGSAKILASARKGKGNTSTSQNDKTAIDDKQAQGRPSSFVGTAEYVSPELLTDKHVSEASDIWAFGCILFQMLAGRPPFKGASEYQTFQKIMRRDLAFPDGFPDKARNLLEKILTLEPDQRPGPADIRAHAFFESVDWTHVWSTAVPELEAGLLKRPAQPESSTVPSKSRDSRDSYDEDNDGIDSEDGGDADDGRSLQSSVDDRSITGAASRGFAMTPFVARPSDRRADDTSSISDADDRPAMRKRGFSTGASTADRMAQNIGQAARKGGNHVLNLVAQGSGSETSALWPGRNSNADQQTNGSQVHILSRPNHQREYSHQLSGASAQQLDGMAMSWAALLLPQESLLYACPVLHKSTGAILRGSSKKRQLLLTDFPRLLCVKETNDQLKVKSEVILGAPTARGDSAVFRAERPPQARDSPESEAMMASGAGMQRQSSRQSASISSQNDLIPEDDAALSRSTVRATLSGGLRRGSVGARMRPVLSSTALGSKFGQGTSSPSSGSMQTMANVMTGVEVKTSRTFSVHTSARSYVYEDPSGDASHWVKSIDMAARRYGVAAASGAR